MLAWLTAMLAQPLPSLKELTIDMWREPLGTRLPDSCWEGVSKILGSASFSNLDRLCIRTNMVSSEGKHIAIELLPGYASRGVLVFDLLKGYDTDEFKHKDVLYFVPSF
jgi:hypothetical protein